MKKKQYEVLYGFEHESMNKKIEDCLLLPLAQRYNQIISLVRFLKLAGEKENFQDVRRRFKTVQILEPKGMIKGKNEGRDKKGNFR